MVSVRIDYDPSTKTFAGSDDFENSITFKSDREINENAISSKGKCLGPMMSLLMATGACSAIDIVMILEKQRQSFDTLWVIVSGEREKNKTPALWEKIEVNYHITGDLERTKAERAAKLSIEKYCSVLETLRRAGAQISYQVLIHLNH